MAIVLFIYFHFRRSRVSVIELMYYKRTVFLNKDNQKAKIKHTKSYYTAKFDSTLQTGTYPKWLLNKINPQAHCTSYINKVVLKQKPCAYLFIVQLIYCLQEGL